jgi:hypothetical protein
MCVCVCACAGQHVGGCHPHGQGLGLVSNRQRPGLQLFLLGLFPDTGSCRLHLDKVSSTDTHVAHLFSSLK